MYQFILNDNINIVNKDSVIINQKKITFRHFYVQNPSFHNLKRCQIVVFNNQIDSNKILFTGLDTAGKTSIILALQREFSQIAFLKPTKQAQITDHSLSHGRVGNYGLERNTFDFGLRSIKGNQNRSSQDAEKEIRH